MKKIIFLLLCAFLNHSCMTEDIHTILRNQEDHEIRIQAFEALCKTINEATLVLQAIADASATGDYLTDIQPTSEGYILTFARHGSFTLKHGRKGATGDKGEDGSDGKNGEDGKDGTNGKDGKDGTNAPVIGIKEKDGVFYWTQTLNGATKWLLSPDGERMRVNGEKGETGTPGTPGKDGLSPVPQLGIDSEGYWLLNGNRIKDENGNEVKAKGPAGLQGPDGSDAPSGIPGPGMFKEVTVGDENVSFELLQPEGTQFTIPRYVPMQLVIPEGQLTDFSFGDTQTLTFNHSGVKEIRFITPARWRARADLTASRITITSPVADEPNRELAGSITVLAFNGKGQSLQANVHVAIKDNL